MNFLGFSIYKITFLYVRSSLLLSSLDIFYLFSSLTDQARISMAMLLGRARVDTSFYCWFSGKHPSFIMSYMIAVDFSQISSSGSESFLHPSLLSIFIMKEWQNLSMPFLHLVIMWFLSFVSLQGILYWLVFIYWNNNASSKVMF